MARRILGLTRFSAVLPWLGVDTCQARRIHKLLWSGQPCQHLCETLMHLQRALRLSIWSGCENVQTSFAWSKISRWSLRVGMQQAECIWCCFWRPLGSKHIQALSHPHQISSFQFALCRRAFPDDWLLAWSEVKMSSHNRSMPFNRLMCASC